MYFRNRESSAGKLRTGADRGLRSRSGMIVLLYAGLLLRPLGAVLGTGLAAVRDAGGVQRAADDVVTGTGKVLDTAAADHDDAVLLKVVAFARDVGRDFDAVGKADTGDLTKRGIRLLRCGRLNGGADAALLRRVVLDRLLLQGIEGAEKRRSLRLSRGSLSTFSH